MTTLSSRSDKSNTTVTVLSNDSQTLLLPEVPKEEPGAAEDKQKPSFTRKLRNKFDKTFGKEKKERAEGYLA